jgi:hypothetical protein
MEDIEKNKIEQEQNELESINPGDEDVFLLNTLESYPDKFPTYTETTENEAEVEPIPEITDPNIEVNPSEEQASIWDNFDNLESPISDESKTDIDEKIEDNTIEIDDDFKKLLEEELQRSSSKEKKTAEDNESINFVPIEEKGDYELIDLSKFTDEARTSSSKQKETHKISPNEKINEQNNSQEDANKSGNEEKNADQQENEKKRRRIQPWIIVAAAIILFAVALLLSLNTFRNMQTNNQVAKKIEKVQPESNNQVPPAKQETNQTDTNLQNNEKISSIDTSTTQEDNNIEPILEKNAKNKKITAVVKPNINQEKITEHKIKEEIPPKSRITKTQREAKASKTVLAENRQNNKQAMSQVAPKEEKSIYTIQVYSTPSKEDAEQWKKKLQSLNIQKAYISEQKIRDVLWYRVRFGEFPTKETAIQAAKQLGFSQMWIDRVK